MTHSPDQTASGSPAAWAAFLAPGAMGLFTLAILVGSLSGWHPLWPTDTLSLSEAVVFKDLASVHTMIAAGVDPNARFRIRPELIKSEALQITPLEAAVSTRELFLLEALLARGATIDSAMRLRLTCFARQENAVDIEPVLAAPLPQPVDCSNVALPW